MSAARGFLAMRHGRVATHTAVAAIAAGLLALAAGGAWAQSAGKGRDVAAELQKRFAAADLDHDGKLTRAEAQAGMPRLYRRFDEIDTAKAGFITLADIAAYARERGAARKAGG